MIVENNDIDTLAYLESGDSRYDLRGDVNPSSEVFIFTFSESRYSSGIQLGILCWQSYQSSLARAPCACVRENHQGEFDMASRYDRKLTATDYPYLAQMGFIAFRKRPGMTIGKLERVLRRQNKLLAAYNYLAHPEKSNPTNENDVRCENCNNCIITGISDGTSISTFSHWCSEIGVPVCANGRCPRGRAGWGPIIQVLKGQMK